MWNLLRDVRGYTEVPLSHLRWQLSTRHALRVPFQGSRFHPHLTASFPEAHFHTYQFIRRYCPCRETIWNKH